MCMELYGDIYSTNLNMMPNVTNFCSKDQKESVSIIHINLCHVNVKITIPLACFQIMFSFSEYILTFLTGVSGLCSGCVLLYNV